MEAVTVTTSNEMSARAWKLHAAINLDAHPNVMTVPPTDTDDLMPKYSSDYVRRSLHDRIDHMQMHINTMHGLYLVTFLAPRRFSMQ